jgi:hypothetical protein
MRLHRAFLYIRGEGVYFTIVSTFRAKGLTEIFGDYIRDTFTDKELAKKLTPNYEVGMK